MVANDEGIVSDLDNEANLVSEPVCHSNKPRERSDVVLVLNNCLYRLSANCLLEVLSGFNEFPPFLFLLCVRTSPSLFS